MLYNYIPVPLFVLSHALLMLQGIFLCLFVAFFRNIVTFFELLLVTRITFTLL